MLFFYYESFMLFNYIVFKNPYFIFSIGTLPRNFSLSMISGSGNGREHGIDHSSPRRRCEHSHTVSVRIYVSFYIICFHIIHSYQKIFSTNEFSVRQSSYNSFLNNFYIVKTLFPKFFFILWVFIPISTVTFHLINIIDSLIQNICSVFQSYIK